MHVLHLIICGDERVPSMVVLVLLPLLVGEVAGRADEEVDARGLERGGEAGCCWWAEFAKWRWSSLSLGSEAFLCLDCSR